jgi:hypothetical protein
VGGWENTVASSLSLSLSLCLWIVWAVDCCHTQHKPVGGWVEFFLGGGVLSCGVAVSCVVCVCVCVCVGEA